MTARRPKSTPTLWADSPTSRVAPVADVAPVAPVQRTYTYAVPQDLVKAVVAGKRVIVPFGGQNRPTPAYVLRVDEQPWQTTLKPILEVLDATPLLDEPLLRLGKWISEYYLCPLGRTLAAMLPEAARRRSGFRAVRYVRLSRPFREIEAENPRLTAHQRSVLRVLAVHDQPVTAADLVARAGCPAATLRSLAARSLIEIDTRREPAPAPDFSRPRVDPTFTLNADQQRALDAVTKWLDPPRFRVGLLFGVAGSGKTEVYVRAIHRCLALGRQAILLVPEIALTSQTAARLAARFENVAIVHSGLTDAQRSLIWNEIALGRRPVVIGTRSAVFAPCPQLGLIVVDEEQEPSLKNQQAPRFHARDVAIMRAHLAGIPILLGSATPALETWHNARHLPDYQILSLPHRVADLPLPRVTTVDMREEHRQRRGVHLLSRAMEEMLGRTLAEQRQAVLLLNRRGYASYLFCPRCDRRIVCPNCKVNLVFHKALDRALCHYCGTSIILPDLCPNELCRTHLIRFGMGTQRVEEELAVKFPSARVARVDSDTMRKPQHYEDMVRRFENRQIDVLLGTQMIAKGLDFPFVAFVGVISADTSLAVPDFRSGERTFQLVTQVAGRAGRSPEPGRPHGGDVIVQTFHGDVDAVRAAVRQDYEHFARGELAARARLRLPPYARLVRIVLADHRWRHLQQEARKLATKLRELLAPEIHDDLPVLAGPLPCPIARIRGQFRLELLIRMSPAQRSAVLARLGAPGALEARVKQLIVDCDPVSLL